MMKKGILLVFALVTGYITAKAQYASLSQPEFTRLKGLIGSDTMVRAAFRPFQIAADKALTEQPNPVEKITTEGKLAGDPDKIKTLKSLEDARKIYSLALVYKIYGNKGCLAKASAYLMAWAGANIAGGNPINDTRLDDIITGYDMIRNSVSADVKTAVDNWLQSVADAELNSKYMAPGKATAINNWNSHRIKIMALIAYTLHNAKYDQIVQNEFIRQIGVNLYPDGNGYDFTERDALHYHIYTLEPLIAAATVIYRATGKDYFNYQSAKGSSVKKSTDFLVPFVTGEKEHGEFLNSHVAFDKARAKNGEKDYQPGVKFNPLTGIHVLEQAAYFDPGYLTAAQQAMRTGSGHNTNWELVLNRVRQPFGKKQ